MKEVAWKPVTIICSSEAVCSGVSPGSQEYSFLVFGFLLLASGGLYYGYSAKATSDLDDFVAVLEPRTVNSITGDRASSVSLFPGNALTADSWNNLFAYEPGPTAAAGIAQEFLATGGNRGYRR